MLSLMVGMTLMAQGMVFEPEGTTLEQAAAKAKAENKLVFMDCYTQWCGPCKKMAKDVFTQEMVGAYMNPKFVNIKVDMESDYGLLPYPLFNESQPSYGTRVQDAVSLWSIPIDAKNPDMSAAVMEALAAQSWRTVTPAYFDVALKHRYSRDVQTAEMADLIKDSIYINFESLYNESIGNPWFIMRNLMTAKNSNFSSYWAGQKKVIGKQLEKAVDKIRNQGN